MGTATILLGDVRQRLKEIPEASVQCCITSPPYWGLRDYGEDGQIGLEQTVDAYVTEMVAVFREVHRVLRDDGVLWLNLGDSYAGSNGNGYKQSIAATNASNAGGENENFRTRTGRDDGELRPKNLVGIPWRVAFALQADGWYLRQDIIWAKPNPMPESVNDRCTKAHEYLFMLTKSARYHFDNIAIKEPSKQDWGTRNRDDGKYHNEGSGLTPHTGLTKSYDMANKRSVWNIPTKPFRGAHFAVMPEALVEPCVLASTSQYGCCSQCGSPVKRQVEEGEAKERRTRDNRLNVIPGRDKPSRMQSVDMESVPFVTVGWQPSCECGVDTERRSIVLDPFTGSGTVAVVALRNGCDFVGTELNPEYAQIAVNRIENDQPMFNTVTVEN